MGNNQKIFNLDSFYDGDTAKEIEKLRNELSRTGFCLVDISRVRHLAKALPKAMDTFFADFSKHNYSSGASIGYMSADWKESFRAFSGKFIENSAFHSSIDKSLRRALEFFDDFFCRLLFYHSSALFKADWPSIETKSDTTFGTLDKKGFGMLDYVKYTSTDFKRNDVVLGHADPGLLSFSLFSDKSGLMLLDRDKDSFVNVPVDKGVIWVGEAGRAASNNLFPTGFHKVSKDFEKERNTFWFEVCVNSQLSEKMLENANIPLAVVDDYETPFIGNNLFTGNLGKDAMEIKVKGNVGIYDYYVTDSTTMLEVKTFYENSTGITSVKTGITNPRYLNKDEFRYENDMKAKDCLLNGCIDFSTGENTDSTFLSSNDSNLVFRQEIMPQMQGNVELNVDFPMEEENSNNY